MNDIQCIGMFKCLPCCVTGLWLSFSLIVSLDRHVTRHCSTEYYPSSIIASYVTSYSRIPIIFDSGDSDAWMDSDGCVFIISLIIGYTYIVPD